jgi:dephospho-CoA kinase
MAAQISDAKRERAADVVIRNAGSMRELQAEADAAWELLTRRAKL